MLAISFLTAALALGDFANLVIPVDCPDSSMFGRAQTLDGVANRNAMAVVVAGDRLYVGGRGGYLSVYDIASNPLKPRLLGRTEELASVRQLAVREDGLVGVVAREHGVWFVDCKDAAHLKVVGHFPSTSNCTGIDLAGNVCFVGGSKSGIDCLDITDPTHPQLIRNDRIEPIESQSVAYRDGWLYSSEWGGKCVTVWDCRDLAKMKRRAMANLAANGDGAWPQGRWLYAPTGWTSSDKASDGPRAGQMGLEIFDIVDPVHPKKMSRLDFEYTVPGGLDMWIARSCGNLVFVASNRSGLYAVDVTDKTAPRILDRWTKKGACIGSIAPGEGVVYIAGPGLGAWVIPAQGAKREKVDRGRPPMNVTHRPPRPLAPKGFHRWLPSDTSRTACVTGLAVKDDFCYAACGAAGLYVLELSSEGIRELTCIPLAECMDVSIAGNRLFVAAGRDGFIGYEFVSPTEFKEILREPSKGARDVYAYGDGCRWVSFNSTVYDIADRTTPKPLVSLVHQARWNKFMCPDLIAGRWTAGNSSLKYFGWADLQADPVVELPIKGYKSKSGAMCAFGDKAFIADNGMWAIVEPGATTPPEMKPFPQGGVSRGLPRSKGTRVSISGAGAAAAVWDFADPASPKLLKNYAFGTAADVAAFWRDDIVIPARMMGVLLPR